MKKCICIIDDEESFLVYVKQACRKIEAIGELLLARNGQEGIDLILSRLASGLVIPKIVFVDINMPVMNGFEFLEKLAELKKEKPELRNIYPVAMLTSSSDFRDREKAKMLGADRFLVKSPKLDELRALIEGCLND